MEVFTVADIESALGRPLMQATGTKIGVYFLLDGDRVVYIGKSKDIESRIKSHARARDTGWGHHSARANIQWDSAKYIVCESEDMALEVERSLIGRFQPPGNTNGTTRSPAVYARYWSEDQRQEAIALIRKKRPEPDGRILLCDVCSRLPLLRLLDNMGIRTFEHLLEVEDSELIQYHGFGINRLNQVNELKVSVSSGSDVEPYGLVVMRRPVAAWTAGHIEDDLRSLAEESQPLLIKQPSGLFWALRQVPDNKPKWFVIGRRPLVIPEDLAWSE